MCDATTMQTISAGSLATSSNTGSSNYAYSIWFYINDWNYKYGQEKIIFARKDLSSVESVGDYSGTSPQPCVSLGLTSNDLIIELSVYGEVSQTSNIMVLPPFIIQNVPIQQWVNFTMSVYGKTLDTYINGKLVKTFILPSTVYVNDKLDIYVTPNGGFDGSTTKFSYYPNSLNPEQAWNIYEDGYSGGILSNLTGSYQLNISVLQNGIEETSLTI